MTETAPPPTRVAIVEDDQAIRDLIVDVLSGEGYDIHPYSAAEAFHRECDPRALDCLILDIMLPGQDGLSLCQQLRATLPRLPILMVTAKGDEVDRIIGFELGADDYLPKPFGSRELLARLRALLRRSRLADEPVNAAPDLFRFAGWTLSVGGRDLIDPDGQSVRLTTGEFDLLLVLVSYPRQILSRELLLDRTHGRLATPCDRTIDALLSRLRRKLRDDPKEPTMIRTIRGDGYLFAPVVLRVR